MREDGTSAVFYSGRFSIAGMTGGFPQSASGGSSADVGAAYQQVKSDVAAVPENKAGAAPALVLQGRQLAADGTPLPYAEQTAGVIRYAPMQQKPPTTITAVNTQPMYPTSDFNIATTALPIPTIISTQTQPVTYKTSSAVNQVSARYNLAYPLTNQTKTRPLRPRLHRTTWQSTSRGGEIERACLACTGAHLKAYTGLHIAY